MSQGRGRVGDVRDIQRQRLYDAEHQVRRQLELAAAGARTVTVAASTVVLPLEVKFGSLSAAQRYTDGVVRTRDFATRFPRAAVAPLRLRPRRGDRSAHYEAPGTIALHEPPHGSGWSLRELVVLHEIAHHAAFHDLPAEAAHGPHYAGALVRIVSDVLGGEAGLLLTTAMAEHDVDIRPIP